jgi:hypothetical protein
MYWCKTMAAAKGQYYSGFDPRMAGQCVFWLDGADKNTLTISSSKVSSWRDKVNGYDISQGTAANRPTYYDGSGVYFTRSNSEWLSTVSANMDLSDNYSVFAVSSLTSRLNPGAANSVVNLLSNSLHGVTLEFSAACNALRYLHRFPYSNLGGADTSFNTPNTFNMSVFSVQKTENVFSGYSNGAFIRTNTVTASNISIPVRQIAVGSLLAVSSGNGRYHDGFTSEIIIYKGSLTSNLRYATEGYLANKWKIASSLPATHPFLSYPPVLRPFAPPDIGSNTALWLDAADATTLTLSGSAVTTWLEKSGNNRHLVQSTSGNRPTYVTSNPRDAYVNFSSASSQYLDISDAANIAVGRPFTAFIVEQRTSNKSNNFFIGGTTNATNSNLVLGYRFDTSATLAFFANDLNVLIPSFATNSNTCVWGFEYTGASQVIYSNGTTLGSRANATNLAAWAGAGLGRYTTNYYDGRIREVVWYTPSLTTTQRQQVDGYLAWKWGRQSDLSSTHPFKTYYPLTPFFNPLILSNCSLWLDGLDVCGTGVVPANSTTVNTWVDKSGNGSNASNAPQNGAVYITASNGLVFSGSNSYATNISSTISPQTIFVVGKHASANLIDLIGIRENVAGGTLGVASVLNANVQNLRAWGGSTLATGATVTQNTTFIYGSIVVSAGAAGTNILYLNGARTGANGSTAPTLSGNGNIMIGAYKSAAGGGSNGAEFFIGTINEVLIYNRVLSSNERQQVDGYLAWKWNLLNNLPAGHPFKTLRP